VWVLAIVAVIIVGGAIGTFFYIRTLYYVGVAEGAPSTVGVYRGVQGSALGVNLDSLTDRSDLPVTALPADDRDRVNAGIQADGQSDARRIVAALRGDACADATASAAPATASPSPSPSRSAHKHRHHRASPSPTPSPPPPYCTATP
jgi:protein phosphatase